MTITFPAFNQYNSSFGQNSGEALQRQDYLTGGYFACGIRSANPGKEGEINSYRIERPDFGDLNPFYNISDPHNISTGNPNLKPEIGDSYELGYSKNFQSGGNIYAAAVYRHNTDDAQSYTTFYPVLNINGTDYTNVSLNKRASIGSQTQIGLNIFGSIPVTNKLNYAVTYRQATVVIVTKVTPQSLHLHTSLT